MTERSPGKKIRRRGRYQEGEIPGSIQNASALTALLYIAQHHLLMFCFRFPRRTWKSLLCNSHGVLSDCKFIQNASKL